MAKLTKAQRRELFEMSTRDYGSYYDDKYKPIVHLLALGLVERRHAKFGGGLYAITPAGRLALASSPASSDEG